MKIQATSDTNFKGYDARALKGFLMSSNCQNIALEMSNIGKKEGFKIYSVKINFVLSIIVRISSASSPLPSNVPPRCSLTV